MLSEGIANSNLRQTLNSSQKETAFSFTAESETRPAGDLSCIDAYVSMSSDYTANFRYNESDKTYTRCPGGTALKDYKTGKTISVKNVFLLYTSVTTFDDDYHTKTSLSGGDGVYISEGGAVDIRWKKGTPPLPCPLLMKRAFQSRSTQVALGFFFVPNSEKQNTRLNGVVGDSSNS